MNQERLQEIVNTISSQGIKIELEYIERMCAAYLMYTDIDPRNVELVEVRDGIHTYWYYRERSQEHK